MQDIAAVAFRVLPAFMLAWLGGLAGSMIGVSHKRLCRLISFAAGTLLGVTLFSIIPETFTAMSLWQLIVALASGYIVFLLISRYVFHVCPACAASHFDEATTHRFSEIASAMVIALGLHLALHRAWIMNSFGRYIVTPIRGLFGRKPAARSLPGNLAIQPVRIDEQK